MQYQMVYHNVKTSESKCMDVSLRDIVNYHVTVVQPDSCDHFISCNL